MISPAIIALVLSSGLCTIALFSIIPILIKIIRHWDLNTSNSLQIVLERRTYLISTLVRLTMAIQLLALFLFVFNAEKMSSQFVGAMCAVGTLQVNDWGFPVLYAQIALFFSAGVWLIINHTDTMARNYPLIRFKYIYLLIILVPLSAISFTLLILYFGNIKSDVITSCCGSLFSSSTTTVTGELAGLSPSLSIPIYFVMLSATIISCALLIRKKVFSPVIAKLAGFFSLLTFPTVIIGIISFLSLYIYEHPHHHCPFCLLQAEHGYSGYLIYIPLFVSVTCGMALGGLSFFIKREGLEKIISSLVRHLAIISTAGFVLVLLFSIYFIMNSRLLLIN